MSTLPPLTSGTPDARRRRTLTATLSLLAAIAAASGAGPGAGPGTVVAMTPAAREITIGPLPLLFADDSGVAARTGVVRRIHVARTLPAPVLEPSAPWEGDRVYIYGSVYRDPASGELRMWYLARPRPERNGADATEAPLPAAASGLRGQGFDLVLYATSRDGLHWMRPTLGLFPYAGSTANNIVFDLHSPSVLLDARETDPAKRYKMLGALASLRGAYYAAYSADGLHWISYPHNPVLDFNDTITLTQDPFTGEYLAYHKRPATIRGHARRVVWLSRSRDFQTWSEPALVFAPDEQDDAWVTQPEERTEVYNMSVYPHAAGFIGLPTIFRVMRERPKSALGPGQSPVDGPIDVELATSADGTHWQRTSRRTIVIPRGAPGTFDGGAILGVSSTLVDVKDETWVYYTAITTGHGAPMPPKRLSIGRAAWRLHGFASLDAGPDGGRVETPPVQVHGAALVVNADASRGQVRLALLEADGRPIAGFGVEDCEPLRTDATHAIVTWRAGAALPHDRPVRIAVDLRSARLFSLAAE